jgi:hypothetical protein
LATPAARAGRKETAATVLTEGSLVRGRDAVAGWCRWVGVVQGAQVR